MLKLKVNTLATSCEELTHLKRPWCWKRLKSRREGDDRGWHGWMASPTQWTWVWVNSRSWWWTGRPGMLQYMGLQRVKHDWTELNSFIKHWHRYFKWIDSFCFQKISVLCIFYYWPYFIGKETMAMILRFLSIIQWVINSRFGLKFTQLPKLSFSI